MKGDIASEVRRLKEKGKKMTVPGSGSIVSQLTAAQLVDTFMIMVDPIALSGGTPILQGITKNLALQLVDHKVFNSGRVLLTYKPKYS